MACRCLASWTQPDRNSTNPGNPWMGGCCGKPIQLAGMLHHRPEREGVRWQSKHASGFSVLGAQPRRAGVPFLASRFSSRSLQNLLESTPTWIVICTRRCLAGSHTRDGTGTRPEARGTSHVGHLQRPDAARDSLVCHVPTPLQHGRRAVRFVIHIWWKLTFPVFDMRLLDWSGSFGTWISLGWARWVRNEAPGVQRSACDQ
jgi:hypothetical protein